MERSEIRDILTCGTIPDYAALHPGYEVARRPINPNSKLYIEMTFALARRRRRGAEIGGDGARRH